MVAVVHPLVLRTTSNVLILGFPQLLMVKTSEIFDMSRIP